MIDRSSNGTLVNGHVGALELSSREPHLRTETIDSEVVGKGKWCHLHTGDAIEVLPSSRPELQENRRTHQVGFEGIWETLSILSLALNVMTWFLQGWRRRDDACC